MNRFLSSGCLIAARPLLPALARRASGGAARLGAGVGIALLVSLLIALPISGGALIGTRQVDILALLGARSPGERAPGAVTTKPPIVRARPEEGIPFLDAPPPMFTIVIPAIEPAAPALVLLAESDVPAPGALFPTPGVPIGPSGLIEPDISPRPAVPEPAVWLTLLVGFGLLGAQLRRSAPRRARA